MNKFDLKQINICSGFASIAHDGQYRKRKLLPDNIGKDRYEGIKIPYIIHPSRVAFLVSMSAVATTEMVATAFLHDILEDCTDNGRNGLIRNHNISLEEFISQNRLSNDISFMVKLLTNDKSKDKDYTYDMLANGIDYDIRYLYASVIKFCDRIDNLQTLDVFKESKRIQYMSDTEDMINKLFIPVSNVDKEIANLLVGTFIENKNKYGI